MILHYISVLTIAARVCVCVGRVGAPCLVCDTRRDGARLDCEHFSTHHGPRGQLITEADGLMVKRETSCDGLLVCWPSRWLAGLKEKKKKNKKSF